MLATLMVKQLSLKHARSLLLHTSNINVYSRTISMQRILSSWLLDATQRVLERAHVDHLSFRCRVENTTNHLVSS